MADAAGSDDPKSRGTGAPISGMREVQDSSEAHIKTCPHCRTHYPGGELFCPLDGVRLVTPSQILMPSSRPPDPLVGVTLSERYHILRRIGEGGMGIVYEAEHVFIEKRVALKVLREDFSAKSEVVERFRQEAKSASRIGHEHIVDISDFGQTPSGANYFVMELLEGEDLASVLNRERVMEPLAAVSILLQCCRALGAAHSKGIVHRDMKPENIFLTVRDGKRDFVKIVDFGIAKMSDVETPGAPGRKLTKTGMIFGTPEYMSPEQASGKSLDHRVDIYAMGVILYELLCGRVPFMGDTFMGVLTKHMFEAPPPLREINPQLEIGPELEGVIFRALAKDANERFQSMDEMGHALEAAMHLDDGFRAEESTYRGRLVFTPRGNVSQSVAVARFPTIEREAEHPTLPPPPSQKKLWIAVALGMGAIALIAGAYFATRSAPTTPSVSASSEKEPAPVAVTPSASTPTPAANPQEAVAPKATTTTVEDAVAPMVSISVVTKPAGAQISVQGRGQVCETTPCSFETPKGEKVEVIATRGNANASKELSPEGDVSLELGLASTTRKPKRRAVSRGDKGADSPGGPSAGDLKIPDIFRNP